MLEILHITPALDLLLTAAAGLPELLTAAREHGFVPLAEAARAEVARGGTTPSEMARIVDLTDVIAGAHSHAP